MVKINADSDCKRMGSKAKVRERKGREGKMTTEENEKCKDKKTRKDVGRNFTKTFPRYQCFVSLDDELF